jgi:VacB/RNase II family 3'-5' exoribonuclease
MFKGNAALLALKQAMSVQNGEPAAPEPAPLIVEGVVSGHPKGYGFLRVDSLTSYFIIPPQMKHCLPGDVVRARIVEEKPGSSNAVIETIVTEGLGEFLGTVRLKGDNFFIVPESRALTGWFFIPHSLRAGLADGQVVKGLVTQHPFKTGKAQARVAQTVGLETDKDILWKVALARQNIEPRQLSEAEVASSIRTESTSVQNLTEMPFVTIDGESTLDMDDAVFAEKHPEQGWWLWVAIADVDSQLLPGSVVDLDAQVRASTTYLPGMVVPMLPHSLSEESLSLMKGVTRSVMCAKMHIGRDGTLLSTDFFQAAIKSRAKLTYQAVSDYVSGQTDLREESEIKASIQNLYWMSKALNNWRASNALLSVDSPDYRLVVSDFQLVNVICEGRNEAMKIIEECMVVANRAFAEFMHERITPFVCRRQAGFNEESAPKITAIARHLGIEVTDDGLQTPEKILEVLKAVNDSDRLDLLLATRTTLTPSMYDSESGHHASLGLPLYATWTSPIRKYSDLINHRLLKALLRGESTQIIAQALIEQINQGSKAANVAAREVSKRLYCRHLDFRASEIFEGTVVGIRFNSFEVEIDGLGARASVQKRTFIQPGDTVSNNEMGTEFLVNGKVFVSIGQRVQVFFDPKDLQEDQLEAKLKA